MYLEMCAHRNSKIVAVVAACKICQITRQQLLFQQYQQYHFISLKSFSFDECH